MSTTKDRKPQQGEAEVTAAAGEHAPRKMTLAENVILTIKVLAGFGFLGAAIWGINLFTRAR